ncbi:DoxX family membrane protein [Isoptericola sp. 4D.3]|uniref:DoxX family membrane protein n=1 Tax=Isoptericola peretonis TaxID=2918523 RepID=A0ABT0J7A6_9MICO|nr:DoxX family membrane protein [Isoptericola sp. 4D.3]
MSAPATGATPVVGAPETRTAGPGRRWPALDARLVAPGPAWRARWVHGGVAAVVGLRLLTRDWTLIADRPSALRSHVNVVGWVPDLPAAALVALQVLGVAAAVLAIARVRPRLAFAVAWAAYLVLAGLWGSSGKVMHNDVLTVTVATVLLFSSPPGRGVPRGDLRVRWGWPPRAALAVVGVVYLLTGVQKLRHSGPGWALGDNMAWVLRQGSSPLGDGLAQALANLPAVPQLLATGALCLELLAPLLLLVAWTRPLFALAVAVMHTSIWACLGLDYSAWVLTVAAVAVPAGLPWRPPWPRGREPRSRVVAPAAPATPAAP